MALIQTVSPEEAEGRVRELYDIMTKRARVIPRPFRMMSPSPELLSIMGQSLDHYFRHPTLGFSLLTHIRLLVARHFDYDYCVEFNSGILQMLADVSEERLEALKKDPACSPLDEKDKAMLLFVLRAVQSPESVEQRHVDHLQDLGWTDKDILEATHHGADMVRHGILFKAFKMEAEE